MKLLKNLVIVIAATGAMGAAQAQTSSDPNLGTLSPTVEQRTGFFGSGSFADTFNFSIGSEHHGFVGSAESFSGTNPAGSTHVSNLTLSVFDASGSEVGSVTSSNGATIDLSGVLVEGTYSAKISGIADGTLGGGYQFSVSATPEPAEWMMLLAGLAVVTFIARRRADRIIAG